MEMQQTVNRDLTPFIHKAFGLFAVFLGVAILMFAIDYANSQVLSYANPAWNGVFQGIVVLFLGLAFATGIGIVVLALTIVLQLAVNLRKQWR